MILLVDGNKQCTSCEETKPLDQFHRSKAGVGGRQSRCKTCTNAERRAFRARHPERERANDKAHYHSTKERHRDAFLRRTYGVTLPEFEAMVAEQGGRCYLCRQEPVGLSHCSVLHMDHNHDTNKPRRPICQNCNQGLGKFMDDPELLEAAAAYLREFA